MTILRSLLFLVLLVASSVFTCLTQTIIHHPETTKPLKDRWSWSLSEAQAKKFYTGFWIGYSIDRRMGEQSYIGSFHSEKRRNRPTLGELLTGMKPDDRLDGRSVDGFTTLDGQFSFDDDEKNERQVVKEVGILFHMQGTDGKYFDRIKVSNLSLHVELGDEPLLWLGSADQQESSTFLASIFSDVRSREDKKHLTMAIGLHSESKSAITFLQQTLQGTEDTEVRGEAAFWLGQTNSDEARKILYETAKSDESRKVREHAIFGLSQMKSEASVDALISIAKSQIDLETRKQATFWLGQKASEKAVGALKELAYKDEETEVQKSALFALTQIHDGGSVDELIKIARTHPNPKIRKQAIFWLGECEDPKAIDALVDILRK